MKRKELSDGTENSVHQRMLRGELLGGAATVDRPRFAKSLVLRHFLFLHGLDFSKKHTIATIHSRTCSP